MYFVVHTSLFLTFGNFTHSLASLIKILPLSLACFIPLTSPESVLHTVPSFSLWPSSRFIATGFTDCTTCFHGFFLFHSQYTFFNYRD